jgi:hypothetical protein
VIGKICPRGRRVGGLIRYLYATGPAQQEGRRRNPHLDPRLVGGFDDPAELEVDDRGASQEVLRRGSGWPKQVARKRRGPSVLPAGSRKCQGTRGPARWRTRNLPGGGIDLPGPGQFMQSAVPRAQSDPVPVGAEGGVQVAGAAEGAVWRSRSGSTWRGRESRMACSSLCGASRGAGPGGGLVIGGHRRGSPPDRLRGARPRSLGARGLSGSGAG